MSIFELFSTRQKKLRGESPDVYQYDELPYNLKVQISHIISDVIGSPPQSNDSFKVFQYIHDALCREFGLFELIPYDNNFEKAIIAYFMQCTETDKCLDIIELSFKIINVYLRRNSRMFQVGLSGIKLTVDEAIHELNYRFDAESIGYQFESGEIIRKDSEFIHSEAVKPTLLLLKSNEHYKGANQEFLLAHEYYRHKKYEASMADCLKSLESLIKGICDQRCWVYTAKDNASKLIAICFDKELIPQYMSSEFTALRSLLESGTPTLRNKAAGHGQGAKVRDISQHMASYCIHLTASNLLFLMECNESL